MVYLIQDSTEEVIQKMIEGAQRMISINNSQEEESEIRISSAAKRHFELEIETSQNAPTDEGKLRELLKVNDSPYSATICMINTEATHRVKHVF